MMHILSHTFFKEKQNKNFLFHFTCSSKLTKLTTTTMWIVFDGRKTNSRFFYLLYCFLLIECGAAAPVVFQSSKNRRNSATNERAWKNLLLIARPQIRSSKFEWVLNEERWNDQVMGEQRLAFQRINSLKGSILEDQIIKRPRYNKFILRWLIYMNTKPKLALRLPCNKRVSNDQIKLQQKWHFLNSLCEAFGEFGVNVPKYSKWNSYSYNLNYMITFQCKCW